MLLQEPVAPHRPLVRRFLSLVHAIMVVHFPWTIETEAHGETFRRKKTAPFFVKEGAVRLDTVHDAATGWLMGALQRHNLPKVIQPEDGRLPSVPGKPDYRAGRCIDVPGNVFLQDMVSHSERLT